MLSESETADVATDEAYALSPIQEGMLTHAILEPGSGIDIVQVSCRLHEPLDRNAFFTAWARIIARHEVLRTEFAWTGPDGASQTTRPQVPISWAEQDWSALSEPERAIRHAELLLADRSRGFALDQAPLFRFHLIECGPTEFRFVFSFHHVILDASSFLLLVVEAFALYEGLRDGAEVPLPPPVPFRRYIDWLGSRDLTRDEAFWRSRLAGFRDPTPLPGNPGPPLAGPASARYGEREVWLDEGMSRTLERTAHRQGLTLNTLTQAAWAILLARHAGTHEVVFGVTRRCRHAFPGASTIVGPMLNTVPMRVAVPSDAPLSAWLQELRLQWNELRDVEHSPPTAVQSWSVAPAGMPLYQTIVVFETAPLDETLRARGGSWSGRDVWAFHQTNYPLTLNGYAGTRLRLRIIYDAERFAPAAIERLLGHLETILTGIAAGASATVGDLPMLTDAERRRLLTDWNATAVAYPPGLTMTDLLEAGALRNPDAIAVGFEDGSLTYAELDRRANQLAHRLRREGVGPGTLVSVCAERSPEMVIALLGVLKAGGAYVPMDPEYPRARLTFMLDDTAAPILLTQERLLDALPPHPGKTLCLDRDWESIAREPVTPPARSAGPDDLAYMIYTSGSTGRPKGALNAHRGIVNRLLWMQDRFGLSAGDAVLQKTPFSFDVSVWEFFWPLLVGARLVLARPGGHRDPEYLSAVIQREQVTVLHFVPSMLRAFLADPASSRCTGLRDVMCSGEALPPDLAALFFERLPARLHNLYGPTEAAVDVTCWTCEPGSELASVPIGRPIANTQTYILDATGKPVPIGAVGELYLGGVQVGLGYRNRPELTAQRFLPDPFSGKLGGTLYRTGDLARYLEDGNIEFLGRIDDQIKIRGFRVELGEIETVLAQQPGVRAAAVAVHQGRPGEQRLIGYYAAASGMAPDPAELRAGLARTLPEYMVPGVLIALPELPLSPNGKLDRKALPVPAAPDMQSHRVAPRNEAERILERVWSELLRRDSVGVTDNFFELGGDSILSIYIAVRARRSGLEIRPKDILQYQTIEAVARTAGSGRGVHAEQGRIIGAAPLTPVQRWFFEAALPDRSYWNQSFLFIVPADLAPARLGAALAKVAEHHDALRLRFSDDQGTWRQDHSGTAPPPLSVVDLEPIPAALRAGEIERRAAAMQSALDLRTGPVLTAALFRAAGEPGRVLLVAHHLVIDGISWGILMQDLETAYLAAPEHRATALPAKSSAFAHWAAGLVQYAADAAVLAERSYWTGILAGGWPRLPPPLSLLAENLEGGTRIHTVSLDEGETAALLREVPAAYSAQINDVLLTAVGGALAEWTGGPDVGIDLEGHGREDVVPDGDFSRTVGWFTSVFPVRLRHDSAAGPGRQLLSTKETLRGVPRHGIGYGVLRYLAESPELQGHPDPEVSFNYLGQFDEVLRGSTLFRFAAEGTGPWRGPRNPRRYRLEINALVVSRKMELRWSWSPLLDSEATVAGLAADTLARLRALVTHCRTPGAGGYSPSDFPLSGLDQDQLDEVLRGARDVADLYPATPMQLLFHTEAAAGSDTGFEQWEFRLRGVLDTRALRRAWDHVHAQHAALRTGFVPGPAGIPLQRVSRVAEAPWTEVDLRGLAPADQVERLAALRTADRVRGFELGQAPLSRIALARVDQDQYVLVWSHHHLVIDRLSWPVVLRDVGGAYEAYREGRQPASRAAPDYREYVKWLALRDLEEAEHFWRREFQDFAGPIELGNPEDDAAEGIEHTIRLDRESAARLVRVARSQRLTLNTIVQGAWALWLSRYAGQADVVFGLAVAGRPDDLSDADRMVGLFINNMPVRARVDESSTTAAWLGALQRSQGERQRFEFTPLSSVYEWSGAVGERRLFESLVVFQNEATGTSEDQWLGPSVAIDMAEVATHTTYPLTLLVRTGQEFELRLVSRGARWASGAAAGVLAQLVDVLSGIAASPLGPVAELLERLPAPDPSWRPRSGPRLRETLPEPYVAPASPLERYLAETWAGLLDIDRVGTTDNLLRLGVHSLLVLRFAARMREDLQVELPVRLLFDGPTVAELRLAISSCDTTPGRSERVAELRERLASMSDDELMVQAGISLGSRDGGKSDDGR